MGKILDQLKISQKKIRADFVDNQLKSLYLDDLGLSFLPSEIGNFKSLEKLMLKNNNLSVLPDELFNLKNLTHLFLGNNKIKTISKNIGKLNQLKVLYLDNNSLYDVNLSLIHLDNLETLNLDNNPLPNFMLQDYRELDTLTFLKKLSTYSKFNCLILYDIENQPLETRIGSSSFAEMLKRFLRENFNTQKSLCVSSNQLTNEQLIELNNVFENVEVFRVPKGKNSSDKLLLEKGENLLNQIKPNYLVIISGDYTFKRFAIKFEVKYNKLVLIHSNKSNISKDWFSINREILLIDLTSYY